MKTDDFILNEILKREKENDKTTVRTENTPVVLKSFELGHLIYLIDTLNAKLERCIAQRNSMVLTHYSHNDNIKLAINNFNKDLDNLGKNKAGN